MKKNLLFRNVAIVAMFMFLVGLAGVNTGFCAEKVNINTADKEELVSLNGIGAVKAERIIEYRNEHPFKSKEEIMEVQGIGEITYTKIKDQIYVE